MRVFIHKAILRIGLFVLLCNFSIQVSAQEDSAAFDLGTEIGKMFSTNIEMSIDESLYPQKMGNFYMSENPVGILMAMAVPQDYQSAKTDMFDGDGMGDGGKIKEKGSFKNNGLEISFVKGISKKEGKKFWMELYTIELTDGNCLFVIGTCDPKAKSTFTASFLNAAKTAKIIAAEGEE